MNLDLNRLGRICLHASENHTGMSQWLTVPFNFEVSGQKYVMASNTKAMVAIHSDEKVEYGSEFALPDHTKDTVPSIMKFPEHAYIKRFPAATIVEWARDPDWGYVEAPCPDCDGGETRVAKGGDCNGTAEVEVGCAHCGDTHKCPCVSCDDGKVECDCNEGKVLRKPEIRPAFVCGVPLDQNLLARALACVPEIPETVSVIFGQSPSGFPDTQSVRISCDDWIVIVMAITDPPNPQELPKFN